MNLSSSNARTVRPTTAFRDPLSLALYYHRNLRRVIPIMLTLVLSFFGIALPVVIVNSLRDAPHQILGIYEYVALVWPNHLDGYDALDAGRLRQLRGSRAVFPASIETTFWPTLVGEAQGGIPTFGVRQADMPAVMQMMDTRLAAGRLPQPYVPELAMHELIARSRGMQIGDTIDPDEGSEDLDEPFRLVGLIEGAAPLVLLNRDYLLGVSPVHGEGPRDRAWLVFAQRPGGAQIGSPQLEAALQSLPRDRYIVRSYQNQLEVVEDINRSLDSVLIVLTLVIVSVLTLAIGLLNYVYVMRRLGEFGILLALGVARAALTRRALLETLVMIGLTWLIGLALTETACWLLNTLLLAQLGTTLTALDPRVLLLTLPLALGGGLSCWLTMLWQLNRLDPVSIIEHRD